MASPARAVIELFHLIFLRALAGRGDDKRLLALKGGCNLRFYFASLRYSEDIDFDVTVIAKETLANKVERLLKSPAIVAPLRSKRIEIVDVSAPKQTNTTQRWKLGLRAEGLALPLRTKVEFSRRDAIVGAEFEATDAEAVRPYALPPILATHYALSAAIIQKIHALADRAEPQARDVFDLDLLMARPAATTVALSRSQRAWLEPAIDHAMAISFDEYRSKVVAYLDPDQAEPFADRAAWERMQETVVSRLSGLS